MHREQIDVDIPIDFASFLGDIHDVADNLEFASAVAIKALSVQTFRKEIASEINTRNIDLLGKFSENRGGKLHQVIHQRGFFIDAQRTLFYELPHFLIKHKDYKIARI